MTPEHARMIASALLHKYKLSDWYIEIENRSTKRFGACNYCKRTIILSAKLFALNSDAECVETILHEIAHALVGPNYGHGLVWQNVARSIGSNGKPCYGHEVVTPIAARSRGR